LSAIFFLFKNLFVSLANLNKKKEDFKKEGKRDFVFFFSFSCGRGWLAFLKLEIN